MNIYYWHKVILSQGTCSSVDERNVLYLSLLIFKPRNNISHRFLYWTTTLLHSIYILRYEEKLSNKKYTTKVNLIYRLICILRIHCLQFHKILYKWPVILFYWHKILMSVNLILYAWYSFICWEKYKLVLLFFPINYSKSEHC